MDKKNLCDLDVAGQKVLVRVEYNVPMDETGKKLSNIYWSIKLRSF